jgi:hypothetical protein
VSFPFWGHYTNLTFLLTLQIHAFDAFSTDIYEGTSKSFRTGRLYRELQIQLCATRCNCIAILWASLVSFAAITLCVASQWVFIVLSVYFFMTQSGNFWIHPRTFLRSAAYCLYIPLMTIVHTIRITIMHALYGTLHYSGHSGIILETDFPVSCTGPPDLQSHCLLIQNTLRTVHITSHDLKTTINNLRLPYSHPSTQLVVHPSIHPFICHLLIYRPISLSIQLFITLYSHFYPSVPLLFTPSIPWIHQGTWLTLSLHLYTTSNPSTYSSICQSVCLAPTFLYRYILLAIQPSIPLYEGVSESFRTGRLERELQMIQLSANTCSCIAILWVILVSFVPP